MSIIDISVQLYEGMASWPGSVDFRLERTMSLERGDEANVSFLNCDVHMGTHIDAPLHFIEGGESVDRIPLDILCGPVCVADLTRVERITESELASVPLPEGTERLLFKTRNSVLWKAQGFDPNYVALTEGAARWIVEKGIRLVGIDYLSVEPYNKEPSVHRILLGGGVIVLEGLNLSDALPGRYELICLPLKLMGAEGAPARALLRNFEGEVRNEK
ncbi:MAG: cyclase family protein [Planctomycetota bacterium]|jgi:arylformamidase